MNKEELIGKLQMVYVGDKNALNELIGYYDGLKEIIKMTQEENEELKKSKHKAIDKLICWGEILDPIFQKEMLDILGNK